jgi:tRNA G18 (ribose-2'-O)-methylase SpoU
LGGFGDAESIARVALVPAGGTPLSGLDLPEAVIFVLGAEREGLPEDVLGGADVVATIPQAGAAESLNVATAGAIALYELRRGRG